MKKIMVILAALILIICIFKKEEIIIPKNSIRFRVIANSNSLEDQTKKKILIRNLKKDIENLCFLPTNKEASRKIIQEEIPKLEETIKKTMKNDDYEINYGMNYFPKKIYKGIVYKEGNYESLVIKLGQGKGKNFWCVLFPPLCLLESDENNNDDVEYTSLIKEIIKRYL